MKDLLNFFLEDFPLFDVLNDQEKTQLCACLEFGKKNKHSFIYLPDEDSNKVFFLSKGAIKIGTHSYDGKEVIKSLIHPKAVFGELGLVGEQKRSDFAQALKEEVSVYTIPVSSLKALMRQNFELSERIMQLLGNRLIKAEAKLESLIFKDARTRIIEFIRDSVEKRGQKVGFEMLLKHSLTHQDIASITCTSRQTVTLVLNELKKSELIYFNRGRILVRDVSKLA